MGGADRHLLSGLLAPLAGSGVIAVAGWRAVFWLVAVAAYIFVAPDGVGTLGLVMTLMMVFLPIAVIWVAVTTLRSVQELRSEAARLHSTAISNLKNELIGPDKAAEDADGDPAELPRLVAKVYGIYLSIYLALVMVDRFGTGEWHFN